jgi:hypothetical protein
MGLGVGDHNPRATALYERLGYRPAVVFVDHWGSLDAGGVRHERADSCVFLVKDLLRTVRTQHFEAPAQRTPTGLR